MGAPKDLGVVAPNGYSKMRHPLFPYDVLPEAVSSEVEQYIKMAGPKKKLDQMSSTDLQSKLMSAKTKTEAIDAFCKWGSQTGAFSDIDRKLWDKLQAWRSPKKQSGN